MKKKDIDIIREVVREEIKEALTVECTMTQKRDPETGIPLKTPRVENRKIYLPAHWIEFLPFFEQSIVAMEEVTEQARNRSKSGLDSIQELQHKVDAIGKLYLNLEKPLKVLAAISDRLQGRELPTMKDYLSVTYEGDSKQ